MTEDQITSIERKLDQITLTLNQVPLLSAKVESLALTVASIQNIERQENKEAHQRSVAIAVLGARQEATDKRIGRMEILLWAVLSTIVTQAVLQILPWTKDLF